MRFPWIYFHFFQSFFKVFCSEWSNWAECCFAHFSLELLYCCVRPWTILKEVPRTFHHEDKELQKIESLEYCQYWLQKCKNYIFLLNGLMEININAFWKQTHSLICSQLKFISTFPWSNFISFLSQKFMLIHYTFILKILYINITNFSLYWFFISYDNKDFLC